MDSKFLLRSARPLILIFILTTAILIIFSGRLMSWTIDSHIVLGGNIVLFAATLISFYFYYKSLSNNKPAVFMRMIYMGMFIKMMICLFAAVIYIMAAGKNVNKGAIFSCMFLYFLYTFIEVSVLMKISKEKSNNA